MTTLDETELVKQLAKEYLRKLPIPKRAEADAYHLAISSAYSPPDNVFGGSGIFTPQKHY